MSDQVEDNQHSDATAQPPLRDRIDAYRSRARSSAGLISALAGATVAALVFNTGQPLPMGAPWNWAFSGLAALVLSLVVMLAASNWNTFKEVKKTAAESEARRFAKTIHRLIVGGLALFAFGVACLAMAALTAQRDATQLARPAQIFLTSDGREAMAALCDAASDTVHGELLGNAPSSSNEVVVLLLQPDECPAGQGELHLRSTDVRGIWLLGGAASLP